MLAVASKVQLKYIIIIIQMKVWSSFSSWASTSEPFLVSIRRTIFTSFYFFVLFVLFFLDFFLFFLFLHYLWLWRQARWRRGCWRLWATSCFYYFISLIIFWSSVLFNMIYSNSTPTQLPIKTINKNIFCDYREDQHDWQTETEPPQ